MNAFKLTFSGTGAVTLTQSLGTLEVAIIRLLSKRRIRKVQSTDRLISSMDLPKISPQLISVDIPQTNTMHTAKKSRLRKL